MLWVGINTESDADDYTSQSLRWKISSLLWSSSRCGISLEKHMKTFSWSVLTLWKQRVGKYSSFTTVQSQKHPRRDVVQLFRLVWFRRHLECRVRAKAGFDVISGGNFLTTPRINEDAWATSCQWHSARGTTSNGWRRSSEQQRSDSTSGLKTSWLLPGDGQLFLLRDGSNRQHCCFRNCCH